VLPWKFSHMTWLKTIVVYGDFLCRLQTDRKNKSSCMTLFCINSNNSFLSRWRPKKKLGLQDLKYISKVFFHYLTSFFCQLSVVVRIQWPPMVWRAWQTWLSWYWAKIRKGKWRMQDYLQCRKLSSLRDKALSTLTTLADFITM
jgi:hypothetical protein